MENQERKNQTTRISLADVIAAKTRPTSQPPQTTKTKFEVPKRSTTRIILIEDEASSALKSVSKAETEPISAIPIQQPTPKAPPTARFRKPSTTQITGFATTAKKGDTTAATVARTPVSGTVPKSSTSRIILKEDAPSVERREDVSAISSPIVGIPVEQEAPKTGTHPGVPITVKLKRPAPPTSVEAPTKEAPIPRTIRIVKEQSPISDAPTVVKKVSEPSSGGEIARVAGDNFGALSTASTVAAQKPPRTIKLKRPSDVGVVSETSEISETRLEEQIAAAKKSETAKIQLPQAEQMPSLSSQAPLTQRKTIKIKRTDRGGQMRTISLKRPLEEEVVGGKAAEEVASDEELQKMEVGTLWSFIALAAVFCVIGLLYILASQSLGPVPVLPVPFEY